MRGGHLTNLGLDLRARKGNLGEFVPSLQPQEIKKVSGIGCQVSVKTKLTPCTRHLSSRLLTPEKCDRYGFGAVQRPEIGILGESYSVLCGPFSSKVTGVG